MPTIVVVAPLTLVGYSDITFDSDARASLQAETSAWLLDTSNYSPGSPAPSVYITVGGGSAVSNGWRVLVSVFSAIAADYFPVKQGFEAIGRSAAFSTAYRARTKGFVPPDFSVEVGNVTLSRYVRPAPSPTTADSETTTIVIASSAAGVVLLLIALFRIKKRRTLATSFKSNAASSGGAVELVHNPGVDRNSGGGHGDCEISVQATKAGAKAAIGGAALAVGLALVSHMPVIGGIATLAIQNNHVKVGR